MFCSNFSQSIGLPDNNKNICTFIFKDPSVEVHKDRLGCDGRKEMGGGASDMAVILQQTVDTEHVWGFDLVYQRDPKLKKKKSANGSSGEIRVESD